MQKVLCLGSVGKDIFFPTDQGQIKETPEDLTSQKKISFELGTKYRIKERYEALGGCAANVAVGLAKLGIEAHCVSQVGDDEIGKWVSKKLRQKQVNTDLVVVNSGKKSDMSAIIVDEASAERTIFSNKNSSGDMQLSEEKIQDKNYIFLGDIHGKWEEQMETVFQLAKDNQKHIIFNPRTVHIQDNPIEIIQAIALCDLVFVNKDEAIEIISQRKENFSAQEMNDEVFLLEKLMELEPKIVVLTNGNQGAWVRDRKNTFFAPAKKVRAVDSTGAGDSFLSGFLAGYLKDKDLTECLQWGITNSANEIQYYGAIDGLLVEEEIVEKAKNVKVERIIADNTDTEAKEQKNDLV
jgi:sugar/nucleoside kinase (ribokinase family)